jgi:hypothetical protein
MSVAPLLLAHSLAGLKAVGAVVRVELVTGHLLESHLGAIGSDWFSGVAPGETGGAHVVRHRAIESLRIGADSLPEVMTEPIALPHLNTMLSHLGSRRTPLVVYTTRHHRRGRIATVGRDWFELSADSGSALIVPLDAVLWLHVAGDGPVDNIAH